MQFTLPHDSDDELCIYITSHSFLHQITSSPSVPFYFWTLNSSRAASPPLLCYCKYHATCFLSLSPPPQHTHTQLKWTEVVNCLAETTLPFSNNRTQLPLNNNSISLTDQTYRQTSTVSYVIHHYDSQMSPHHCISTDMASEQRWKEAPAMQSHTGCG